MVIVPGFGAFISEYQPAEIDDTSDEIKPPSTRLVFNPQIKNNDGLLVGYVAELLRSSHFEALQKIEKERDDIIYRLDKGEKVKLENLGTLTYNADNQIEFSAESDENLSHESFGLEAALLTEPDTEPEAPAAEETRPEEEAPAVAAEEETPVVEEATPAEEAEPVEEATAEAETVQETTEETPEPEQEKTAVPPVILSGETSEQAENAPEERPEPAPVSAAMPEEPKEEKRRKGGWLWLLVVLIPLIAVSIFLLMKDKKSAEPAHKQTIATTPEIQEETTPVATIDTVAADSSAAAQNDSLASEEIAQEPASLQEDDGPKFYLIGGSFKEEENAETYLQQLKAEGYDAFKMDKYGNFYIVGIARFDTEEQATVAKQEFLDKNPGSGIWILEK